MSRFLVSLGVVSFMAAVIGIMAAVTSLFPDKPDYPVEKVIRERVVKISAFNEYGSGQGTGTMLGQNYILTNAHLFPQKEKVSIVFRKYDSSKNIPAVVVSSDTKRDFAILEFKGKDDTVPLPITGNWKLGESIILLGNPGVGDFIPGHTRIVGLTYLHNPFGYGRHMLVFPCDTGAPGFSGSGIWNLKGEFIGIFELYSPMTNMCLAIPAIEVIDGKLDRPWDK